MGTVRNFIYKPFISFMKRCYYKNEDLELKKNIKKFHHFGNHSHIRLDSMVVGWHYIGIGDYFSVGRDLQLGALDNYENIKYTPSIIIGDKVTLSNRIQISCIDRIEIGDGCLFGNDVYVSDNSHGEISADVLNIPPYERELTSKGPVIIGKNVWIGRCTTVLSGVTIGDNAIIGANSVVNTDIPANCVAVGCPAKVIKYIK